MLGMVNDVMIFLDFLKYLPLHLKQRTLSPQKNFFFEGTRKKQPNQNISSPNFKKISDKKDSLKTVHFTMAIMNHHHQFYVGSFTDIL